MVLNAQTTNNQTTINQTTNIQTSNNQTNNNQTQSYLSGAENCNKYLNLIKGKSVALVCNQGSRIGNATLADSLMALGVQVKKIFFPEHGFDVKGDAGAKVKSFKETTSGIRYISLYGKKKKPSPSDLADVEYIIFDLQDVGVRCYTYLSTLHNVMEACAENKKILIVLDRPNPNGDLIDGPVLDLNYKSFVGMDPVPLVYGMTIGEYAQMINAEGWLKGGISCHLKVVPMVNYNRNGPFPPLLYPPSPNLNSTASIQLYPTLVLFEGTVVSVGRGTEKPFCAYGFPGYQGGNFQFTPHSRPGSQYPPYKDTLCMGINLIDSVNKRDGIHINWIADAYEHYQAVHGSEKSFFVPFFNNVAGNSELKQQIINHQSLFQIKQSWQADIQKFKLIRAKYLLY